MKHNRDWHAAPYQGGGRDAYDYGRSGDIRPMCTVGPTKILPLGKALLWAALSGLVWVPVVLGILAIGAK